MIRRVFLLAIVFLTILFYNNKLFAQEDIKASFRLEGDKIVIEYIIENGDPTVEYEVKEVALRKEGDILFKYEPLYLEGDLGTGYFAQKQNKIIWIFTAEEKQNLSGGEGYYFDIVVEKAGGGIAWYTWVIGAAATVGGLALAIMSGDENVDSPTSQTIPNPPTRPKN